MPLLSTWRRNDVNAAVPHVCQRVIFVCMLQEPFEQPVLQAPGASVEETHAQRTWRHMQASVCDVSLSLREGA